LQHPIRVPPSPRDANSARIAASRIVDGSLERRPRILRLGLCDYCDQRARFQIVIGELGTWLVCQTHVTIADVSKLGGPFAPRTITEIRDTV
jgi:hypothetical protein